MPSYLGRSISIVPERPANWSELGLIAHHNLPLSLDLISELGAIEFGHGTMDKPAIVDDAVDHRSNGFGLLQHCRGEHLTTQKNPGFLGIETEGRGKK